ncbi:putative serine/threonine-protein kinase F31E3.2 [Trichinella pseudospiralis]|uniref:Putative serine/threonine-protein kinase F31E3.2 n=1 Tax=Trichinella pseudospiralis TaxID=6337 RepID=A0A0V1G053_TRIPS|nr:putative serine/threonine-protein kinase F31E3.2 [Trichinella pseudospiralis]
MDLVSLTTVSLCGQCPVEEGKNRSHRRKLANNSCLYKSRLNIHDVLSVWHLMTTTTVLWESTDNHQYSFAFMGNQSSVSDCKACPLFDQSKCHFLDGISSNRRYYTCKEKKQQHLNKLFLEKCAMLIADSPCTTSASDESLKMECCSKFEDDLLQTYNMMLVDKLPLDIPEGVGNDEQVNVKFSKKTKDSEIMSCDDEQCAAAAQVNKKLNLISYLQQWNANKKSKKKPAMQASSLPGLFISGRPASLNVKCLSDSKLQSSFRSFWSLRSPRTARSLPNTESATSLNSLTDGRTPWPIPWLEAVFLPEFPNKGPLNEKLFQENGILSRGKFSTVYKARLKAYPQTLFAMKVQRKSTIISENAVRQVKDELKNHQTLSCHPFIAQLYGSWQSRTKIYMVMNYVSGFGDLYEYWRYENLLPPRVIKLWAAELGIVLDYMHSKNIVYRDLKMENILLNEQAHIRLVDFGFSKQLDASRRTNTICGTLNYMAPEIFSGFGYDCSVDWWSLGVLLHTLAVGEFPFQVSREKIHIAPGYRPPRNLDQSLQRLLLKLLRINSAERIQSLSAYQKEAYFADVSFEAIIEQKISPLEEINIYKNRLIRKRKKELENLA